VRANALKNHAHLPLSETNDDPRKLRRSPLQAQASDEAPLPLPTPDPVSAPALQISTPLAAPPVTTPSPWSEERQMVADVDGIYGLFGSHQWTATMSLQELTKGFGKKAVGLPLQLPSSPPVSLIPGMTALRAMCTTEDERESILGRVPPQSPTLTLRNMSTRSLGIASFPSAKQGCSQGSS